MFGQCRHGEVGIPIFARAIDKYILADRFMHANGTLRKYMHARWTGMAKNRNNRQEAIRSIVRKKAIRTQRELVVELRRMGYVCTQATVSRDVADMGLRKLHEGVYVLAEDLHLQQMVSAFVEDLESVANQVVIMVQVGTAPGVAAAIDSASPTGVVGTIAGNDTVLVICRDEKSAAAINELVRQLKSYR